MAISKFEDSTISVAERERRQKAVDFAHASVGLEGFKLSDEAKKHAQRFVNGEIDLKEFIQDGITAARQMSHTRLGQQEVERTTTNTSSSRNGASEI